jgi:hypothetical protein
MTEAQGGRPGRRRRRGSSRQGPPLAKPADPLQPADPPRPADPPKPRAAAAASATSPSDGLVAPPSPAENPAAKQRRARRAPRDAGEGGLHDLIGGGRSQLGVSGALRGRDVNRPSDDELAEAERDLQIVRRNWKPNP